MLETVIHRVVADFNIYSTYTINDENKNVMDPDMLKGKVLDVICTQLLLCESFASHVGNDRQGRPTYLKERKYVPSWRVTDLMVSSLL